MLRKESEAVPEGKGPVPQQEKFGSGKPTLADSYRLFEERFDKQLKIMSCFVKMDKISEDWRSVDQRLTRLEHDARQRRLAMEADGPATTTRERTEGAATAVQAKQGDSCSADRVDLDPMCSTSFGDDCPGPPAPPCSGENALVDNGAAAPKSCLPSSEMRSPTAAGGLLPTGETSTTTKIIFNQLSIRLYSTEEAKLRTRILYVLYGSSFLPAGPSCRRVIETKSGENGKFDPGGSRSSPRLPVFGIVARVALWGGSY